MKHTRRSLLTMLGVAPLLLNSRFWRKINKTSEVADKKRYWRGEVEYRDGSKTLHFLEGSDALKKWLEKNWSILSVSNSPIISCKWERRYGTPQYPMPGKFLTWKNKTGGETSTYIPVGLNNAYF